MACNCGKRKGSGTKSGKGTKKAEAFVLQNGGSTQTFGSRLEAQAANQRAGGTGTIRPAVR